MSFLVPMIIFSAPLPSNPFVLGWRLKFQRHFPNVSPLHLASLFMLTVNHVPLDTFFPRSVADCGCCDLVLARLVVMEKGSLLF